jgi:hypothetical protein
MGEALGVIWLQAGEAQGGDPLGFLIPMGAIFLIFCRRTTRICSRRWEREIGW